MSIILEAARFAELRHRGVFRKYTGDPYIVHPARVASVISYLPCSTEVIVAAAWLHDILEDTDVSTDYFAEVHGARITELVLEVTNPSKKYPNLPRKQRKAMDLEHIRAASKAGKIIKMVDRIDNLLDYPVDNEEARKFVQDLYYKESVAVYHATKDADEYLAERFFETLDKIYLEFGVEYVSNHCRY